MSRGGILEDGTRYFGNRATQVFSRPEFADYSAKNLVLLEVDFPQGKKQSAEQKAANEKLAQ
jgi:hypothetical protein